jgi:hypothetical protein
MFSLMNLDFRILNIHLNSEMVHIVTEIWQIILSLYSKSLHISCVHKSAIDWRKGYN